MALRTLLPALFLATAVALPLRAQIPVEFGPGSSELSRDELTRLLRRYEEALQSPAYSGGVKEAARANAARIRARLENGDFHVGDRVVLSVQGEPNLPDTLVVEPGPQITLPLFGSISLAGVLRSEIEEHLTRELGKVIHEPVVRAQGLMRLSIQGAVVRPGFYVVPADLLVSDALMMAGGPGSNSSLDALRIERGTARLLEGQAMQDALQRGLTLDQLNLQAGDQLFVPTQGSGAWGSLASIGVPILSALIVVLIRG